MWEGNLQRSTGWLPAGGHQCCKGRAAEHHITGDHSTTKAAGGIESPGFWVIGHGGKVQIAAGSGQQQATNPAPAISKPGGRVSQRAPLQ